MDDQSQPKTFHYFAYGSNMMTARLLGRCPSAKVVSLAHADGYKLAFSKLSVDTSGKATLIPFAGQCCGGVLFAIDLKERPALDKFEGDEYQRDDAFPVINADGSTFKASTYLARDIKDGLVPYHWYLALIIAGCHEHKLDTAYVAELRKFKWSVDTKLDRKTHRAAVQALETAGIADIAKYLSAA